MSLAKGGMYGYLMVGVKAEGEVCTHEPQNVMVPRNLALCEAGTVPATMYINRIFGGLDTEVLAFPSPS